MTKRLLFYACMWLISLTTMAQEAMTITVTQPGTLQTLIQEAKPDFITQLTQLTVKGSINGTDIATLRRMSGGSDDPESYVYVGVLRHLDISEATLVSGGDAYYSERDWSTGGTKYYYAKADTLPDYAFYQCARLQTLVLPQTARALGQQCFAYCSSLQKVDMGPNIDRLPRAVFGNCTGLKNLVIPSSVKFIDEMAFSFCNNIRALICTGTKPAEAYYKDEWSQAFDYMNTDYTRIYVPNGAAAAYRNAPGWNQFQIVELATDAVIGSTTDSLHLTITKAGTLDSTLYSKYPDRERNLRALKVTGPINGDDIILIRVMTSSGATSMLNLADANIVAGGRPYHSDYDIALYTSPGVVGREMFMTSQMLHTLILPQTTERIDASAAFNGRIAHIIIEDNPKYFVDNGALYLRSNSETDATSKQTMIFFPKAYPTPELNILDGTTAIADSACYYHTTLRSVTFPASVTEIGVSAFEHTDSLRYAEIPEGVSILGARAFNFSGLQGVDLPSTLTAMGERSLACGELEGIVVRATVPPTLVSEGWDTSLSGIDTEDCELHVPKGYATAYAQAPGWKEFKTIIDDIDPAALNDVRNETPTMVDRFDVNGRPATKETRGIVIERYSDGTARKCIVR